MGRQQQLPNLPRLPYRSVSTEAQLRHYNRLAPVGGGLGLIGLVALTEFFAVAGGSGQLTTPIPFYAMLGLTIATSVAAIVSGHLARGQIRRSKAQAGKGLALAALVAGYGCVAIAVLTLPLTLFMLAYLGCQYQGPGSCS